MSQSKDVTGRDLPPFRGWQSPRRRRGLVVLAALVAFAVGLVVGGRSGQAPAERVAQRFTTAWEHGDYRRMWELSGGPPRPRAPALPPPPPAAAPPPPPPGGPLPPPPPPRAPRSRAAAIPGTTWGVHFDRPRHERAGVVEVPATISTRVWGTLRATLRLPMSGDGDTTQVRWAPRLVFPGLRGSERLRRETTLPAR